MQRHSREMDSELFGLCLPRVCTCRDTPECYTAPPGQTGKLSTFSRELTAVGRADQLRYVKALQINLLSDTVHF